MKIFETIADIAYSAGVKRYYSGNSREDMQEFVRLAKKFEEQYEGTDWEDTDAEDHIDYMDAIEEFITENIRFVEKFAFDYPNGTKYEWDNIEIAGCKDDGESTYRVDDPETETPDFWTVYLHMTEGGAMAVADVPTEKEAEQLGELIHNAVLSFKDNGYMALHRNGEAHRKFNLFIDERIHNAINHQTRAAYEIVKDQFNSLIKP